MASSQRRTQPVYEITGMAANRQADLQSRARRYMISMAVRTVCFVAAVVASGWARWTLIVAALVLPYVAVLIANAGRESGGPSGERVLPPVPAAPALGLPPAAKRGGPTVPGQASTPEPETTEPETTRSETGKPDASDPEPLQREAPLREPGAA